MMAFVKLNLVVLLVTDIDSTTGVEIPFNFFLNTKDTKWQEMLILHIILIFSNFLIGLILYFFSL